MVFGLSYLGQDVSSTCLSRKPNSIAEQRYEHGEIRFGWLSQRDSAERKGRDGEKAGLKFNMRNFRAPAVVADLPTERDKNPESSDAKLLDFLDIVRNQLDELTKQKEQSEKKAADYFDKLQRLQADMENLQKITKRQVETVTKQASEGLLIKLLPILDALQQATNIAHSDNQLPKGEMAVGLKMLLKQLIDVLRTEGLEEIPAVGHQFDPTKHEVVSFVEKDDISENTIMEEIRKGYLLNGKVIRTSLVVVSKPTAPKEKTIERAGEK